MKKAISIVQGFYSYFPSRLWRHLVFFFLLAAYIGMPFAQPPTEPILTLNGTMHFAKIGRISTDSLSRLLLSCSDDKTAKLWNAANGELIRTFRPPIAGGYEGMLYACALSPDGQIAAVAGWTAYEWDKKHCIYLFNTTSGDLIKRLTGMENVTNDLEFSLNGQYLAAALGGNNGIRIFKVRDWSLFKSLKGYNDNCYNVAFDRSGRLAAVSFDGTIHLYSAAFKQISQVQTTAGERPFSIAFSPDGKLLAVGYDDVPTLEVRDATSLNFLYQPVISGATTSEKRLEMVCFSADGSRLFAGGLYRLNHSNRLWQQIRCWEQAGHGKYIDWDAASNIITDLKPAADGGVFFSSGYPDLGRMNADDSRIFFHQAETHNLLTKDCSHLRIDDSGQHIGLTPSRKTARTFSLSERQMTFSAASDPAPKDRQGNIILDDWKDNTAPKLNGLPLGLLHPYERSQCVDINDDGSSFILGADWNLYCANARGQKRWQTPAPEMVCAVNISGNGRIAAAAISDGTLRWYRMSDGTLLLSLYAHPDDQRWILWSPKGYYDCAPGAEDFIGWHVNNGVDQAGDYFPASRFRTIYYRPDVIDKILQTLDESQAIQLANQESNRRQQQMDIRQLRPPILTILSPITGAEISSQMVTISFRIRTSTDAPVLALKAFLDGRPVETQRGIKADGIQQTMELHIPPEDCKIALIAENRFGASDAAVVQLRWRGTKPMVQEMLKPTLYVLAIGVSAYANTDLALQFAAKDARDFNTAMQRQKGLLYNDVISRVLIDEEATKDNILDGLDWLQRQTTSRDVAALFLAGHGVDDAGGAFYFLPIAADLEYLKRTGLMFAELRNTVASVAGKMLLFIDACHSGKVMGSRRAANISGVVNELTSAENGAVVFSSSSGREYSLEDFSWGNGAFTKALVEGLHGKADLFGTSKITIMSLHAWIANRVKELTGGRQHPTVNIPSSMPDFPIAVVR